MLYFIDSEFQVGELWPTLISIGVVANDGREYYAECAEYDRRAASTWVADHVVPKLGPEAEARSSRVIRDELTAFFRPGAEAIWGMVPSYDWVLFHGLFGGWKSVPDHIPWFFWDLRQWQFQLGDPDIPDWDPRDAHHALKDARRARDVYASLARTAGERVGGIGHEIA